jgi:choline dehydrogenase-like flavoprotein
VAAEDHYDVIVGANPTLTIIANALRVADRIKERLA